MFTFSVHCGKNFPLRKQQSDLDISLDDGLEDKEYLSTGTLTHYHNEYNRCTHCNEINKKIRTLTNMSNVPQWRLTFPGCWTLSVQTWFSMTPVSILTGRMSSGGSG